MNKEFILVTKGILPLSVLMLLAVALIAGQSGTSLSSEDRVAATAFKDVREKSVESQSASFRSFDLLVTMPNEFDLHALIPKGAINPEILTNRKLSDH